MGRNSSGYQFIVIDDGPQNILAAFFIKWRTLVRMGIPEGFCPSNIGGTAFSRRKEKGKKNLGLTLVACLGLVSIGLNAAKL